MPPFVTAHTFCASQAGLQFLWAGWYLFIQRYFFLGLVPRRWSPAHSTWQVMTSMMSFPANAISLYAILWRHEISHQVEWREKKAGYLADLRKWQRWLEYKEIIGVTTIFEKKMERKCRTLLCIQGAFLVIIIISEKYVVYLQFYFCNPVSLANICFSLHSYKLCKNTSVLGGTVINPILRPRRKVPPL